MSSAANQHQPASDSLDSNAGATLKNLKAHARVNFPLIVWTVEQTFVNPGAEFVELVYTFPTAYGSMLQNISVVLDERRLSGVVVPAEKADNSYSDAIADGDSAILIEKNEFGLYTMNIGNLGPGETCKICFESAALLDAVDGQAKIIFPTVIDTRYGEASNQGGLGLHATPQSSWLVEYPLELSVTLNDAARQFDISSATHKIKVTQGESLTVSLGEISYLDRDFELTLGNISPGYPGLVFRDPFSDIPQYISLSNFAWKQTAKEHRVVKPSTLNILVDCSGSMNGDRIEQAKKALHSVLASLHTNQKFTLSRFGNDCQHFYNRPIKVGLASLKSAFDWIESLQADMGGTEMIDAIDAVANLVDPREDQHSDLFLITDGDIWDGEEFIHTLNAHHFRLFVVAIGSSSNSNMLTAAARATGGHAEVPHSDLHIEQATLRLHTRTGSPRVALTRFTADGKSSHWSESTLSVFPDQSNHLFAIHPNCANESVLAVDFIDARQQPSLVLQSRLVEVQDRTVCETLARLCILRTLVDLEREYDELMCSVMPAINFHLPLCGDSELEALAIQYQVLTERTKYLLVEERQTKADGLPNLINIEQMQVNRQMERIDGSRRVMFSRSGYIVQSTAHADFSIPSFLRSNLSERLCTSLPRPVDAKTYPASFAENLVAKSRIDIRLRVVFDDHVTSLLAKTAALPVHLQGALISDYRVEDIPGELLNWATKESSHQAEMDEALGAISMLLSMAARSEYIHFDLFEYDSMARHLAKTLGFLD